MCFLCICTWGQTLLVPSSDHLPEDTHILYCQLHLCCDNQLISLIRQWPISQAGLLWLVHHNPHAGYIDNCPPPELCLFLQQCDHKKSLLLMSVISCAKEKLKLWCYFLAIVHFSSCSKLHLSNYLIKVSIHKQHFFHFTYYITNHYTNWLCSDLSSLATESWQQNMLC